MNDFKRNCRSSNKKIRLLKSCLTLKGVHQIVRQSYKEFNQAETQTCRGNLRKKACLVHLRKIIMKSNSLTSSLRCKEKRITKTCSYIVLITSVICKQIMALRLYKIKQNQSLQDKFFLKKGKRNRSKNRFQRLKYIQSFKILMKISFA